MPQTIVRTKIATWASQPMTTRMRPSTGTQPIAAQLPWQEQVRQVRADPTLMRFIGFAALMGFTINLFGPFFPVFMYDELSISVAKANWILLFGPLGAALSFPAWGRLLDRFGNIPVMVVSVILWQLFNLIWCFVDGSNLWLLYVVSTTGGLFSAGYGIGVFNLMLKLTPPASRTMGIALFISFSCLAAAVGPPTGGYLISWAKAAGYEPLANALARRLIIDLPTWLPAEDMEDNWQSSPWDVMPGFNGSPE